MLLDYTVVGPLQVNCYLLGDEATHEAVIIDPGDAPRQVLARLNKHGLKLTAILCTHAHFEHVLGIRALQEATGARLLLHQADLPVLHNVPAQTRLWLGQEAEAPPEPDGFLNEGDVVHTGSIALRVVHVPGHSPGSVAFVDDEDKLVFAGDTLFAGSIGRTDIPGGDYDTLMDSIHDKLLPLDDAYRVYPGHGSPTTMGEERETNPFLAPDVNPW